MSISILTIQDLMLLANKSNRQDVFLYPKTLVERIGHHEMVNMIEDAFNVKTCLTWQNEKECLFK